MQPKPRGRSTRLSTEQLTNLHELLQNDPATLDIAHSRWTRTAIIQLVEKKFGVSYHVNYAPAIVRQAAAAALQRPVASCYFASPPVTLYSGDASAILATLPANSVDCIVTSPPYYGQRDYGVAGQIGLEQHPQHYIDKLVNIFYHAKRALKPTGSLWVNIGDTYWSGKGRPKGDDLKQKHRRFLRPQDAAGPRPLCTPKQLLLIPHRFAIAMQDDGWIVRNDNVWHKTNPTPDPVDDRSASAHEYVFHFVKNRRYYYNQEAVAVQSKGNKETKAPPSVWTITSASTFKKHIAVFPEELVRIPIHATLPPDGVLLDPFCGSATTLIYALRHQLGAHLIGIDISIKALAEAQTLLTEQLQR
jgi:site-specific DNA-methyltransferase (adenine-specific)